MQLPSHVLSREQHDARQIKLRKAMLKSIYGKEVSDEFAAGYCAAAYPKDLTEAVTELQQRGIETTAALLFGVTGCRLFSAEYLDDLVADRATSPRALHRNALYARERGVSLAEYYERQDQEARTVGLLFEEVEGIYQDHRGRLPTGSELVAFLQTRAAIRQETGVEPSSKKVFARLDKGIADAE